MTEVRQMLVQLHFPSLLLVTEDENTLIAGATATRPPATFTALMESIANQNINEKVFTPFTFYFERVSFFIGCVLP